MSTPLFRFKGRYVSHDPEGYFHTRWDRANPVSVLAHSKDEAGKKLWAMLGEAPQHRTWTVMWDSIDEELQTKEAQS